MTKRFAFATLLSFLLFALQCDCTAPASAATVRSGAFTGSHAPHERHDAVLSGGIVKRTRTSLQKDRSALLHQELERLKKLPRSSR
jgi:hypothetical protein